MKIEIRTVGVIGCGLMGSGIAEVSARTGYQTVVREVDEAFIGRGRARIERSLNTAVQRGKLQASARDEALGRIRFTTSLADLADCDLVVEAATENPKLKQEVFAELDRVCQPHTILASNTSSIPIIELAAATNRQDRVAGLHFFNPVPVMKLMEVIRTISTSDETRAPPRSSKSAPRCSRDARRGHLTR